MNVSSEQRIERANQNNSFNNQREDMHSGSMRAAEKTFEIESKFETCVTLAGYLLTFYEGNPIFCFGKL